MNVVQHRSFVKIKAHTNQTSQLYRLNHYADIAAKKAVQSDFSLDCSNLVSWFKNTFYSKGHLYDGNIKTMILANSIQQKTRKVWNIKKFPFMDDIDWVNSFIFLKDSSVPSYIKAFQYRAFLNILPTLHLMRKRNNNIIPEWESCPSCGSKSENMEHIFIECIFYDDIKVELKSWALDNLPTILNKEVMSNFLNIWIPTSKYNKMEYHNLNLALWFKGVISLSLNLNNSNNYITTWLSRLATHCSKAAYEIWIKRCNEIRDNGLIWSEYTNWMMDFYSQDEDLSQEPKDMMIVTISPPITHFEHSKLHYAL